MSISTDGAENHELSGRQTTWRGMTLSLPSSFFIVFLLCDCSTAGAQRQSKVAHAGIEPDRNRMIAVTVEESPTLDATRAIAAILLQYDIPATFFVVTDRIGQSPEYRELVLWLAARGFAVASNTSTHADLSEAAGVQLDVEIDESISTLDRLVGAPTKFFRAKTNTLSEAAQARLRKLNVRTVGWTIDANEMVFTDPETRRRQLWSRIIQSNGGVIRIRDVAASAFLVAGLAIDLKRENCRRVETRKPLFVPVPLDVFDKGLETQDLKIQFGRRTETIAGACKSPMSHDLGDFPPGKPVRLPRKCSEDPMAPECQ